MEWFDDIFDIPNDDDSDSEELETIIEQYNQDFDFDYVDTNVDDEIMIIENNNIITTNNEIFKEQEFSQKLSQLSTKDDENDQEQYPTSNKKRQLSTPSTPTNDVNSKKIRQSYDDNNNKQQGNDQMPEYLRATNEIFDEKMACYVMNSTTSTTTTNTILMEDLRQLAHLKHKIAVVNLAKELWTVYLKFGTGQWTTEESNQLKMVDRRFWSKQVKQMARPPKQQPSNTTDINQAAAAAATTDEQKQNLFENFVNEYLHNLNKKLQQYQNEFNEKKNYLSIDFTNEIEKAIEIFVEEHGIQLIRMKCSYKITMLEYEYDNELLEREYLRLQPSDYQKEIATRLCHLRHQYIKRKLALIELKQRILCNKPTAFMNSTSLSMSTSTSNTNPNEKVRHRRHLTDQEEKEIEEKITNMMAEFIAQTEQKCYQSQQLFYKEIHQISSLNDQDNNNVNNENYLPENLLDLIYRRFNIIQKRLDYLVNFRVNYLFRTRYGHLEDSLNIANIGFSPTMIIDTPLHQFTREQLKLLNRGPTYVPPCQMYVSSSSCVSSNHDMIQKQFKPLQHDLNILFDKYGINTAQSMFITKQIKDAFINVFSISSLPVAIHQRATYENQLVESIREHLKVNDLILRRTADQRNVFYLGYIKDFQEKINEFMTKNTDLFEICETIDEHNLRPTREYLTKIYKSMNSELEKILNNKTFYYKCLLESLHVDASKVQLPYLYFLPDVSKKDQISVKPTVVSQCSATSRLAQILDGLIRPVIQRHAESTTFINGADFIRKLNRYADEQHRLHSRTIFTTIKISNYHTMVPHTTMLTILEAFFHRHLATLAIDMLSIKKIINLTSLFLNNNRFYYDNKIYRFTKGSPSSLLFTETLSNICAFQWQNVLLRERLIQNEFFGRCKNQIFFTWNETVDELRQFLMDDIVRKHPNVQLEVTIGQNVQFLNINIENQNGTLYTCVYHDPNIQKYTLPYVIGDAKAAHSHWFRSTLIRAVRYCTSVYDFNRERIYLEISCLANGYSLEFVDRRINHFFTYFDATSLRSVLNQQVYNQLRLRLFNFISEQQQFIDLKRESEKKNQRVQLTYLYQFGSKHKFHKKLREILSENVHTAAQFSKKKTKIILTPKQQYSLNALLSQQKPFHQLLNKEKPIF